MTFTVRQGDLWRWLDKLRYRAKVVDGRLELTGPPGKLPPELIERIRASREDLLADLEGRQALNDELERNLRQATSWLDLETAVVITEKAHAAAALSRWQARRLTALAILLSRRVPPEGAVRARQSDIGLFNGTKSNWKGRINDAERQRQELRRNREEAEREEAEEEAMEAAQVIDDAHPRREVHVQADGQLAFYASREEMPVATTLGDSTGLGPVRLHRARKQR